MKFKIALKSTRQAKPHRDRVKRLSGIAVQFAELCQVRRSIRWFEERTAPREAVDRAIHTAGTVPSASNRQSFQYLTLIFDNVQSVREIAAILMDVNGFSENLPPTAVLTGDLGAYFDKREKLMRYKIWLKENITVVMLVAFGFARGGSYTCLTQEDGEPIAELQHARWIGVRAIATQASLRLSGSVRENPASGCVDVA